MVRNNNSLAASRCRLNQLWPRKWASSHFYARRASARSRLTRRAQGMSAALLCPRSRTQNERAFGLRSQRVRHLRRQRSGRASARSALPPIDGHRQCDASCTRSANSVIWHRSKTGRTRITSSARASSVSTAGVPHSRACYLVATILTPPILRS